MALNMQFVSDDPVALQSLNEPGHKKSTKMCKLLGFHNSFEVVLANGACTVVLDPLLDCAVQSSAIRREVVLCAMGRRPNT